MFSRPRLIRNLSTLQQIVECTGIKIEDVAGGAPLIGKALEQRSLDYVAIRVGTVAALGLVRCKAGLTHLPAPARRRWHAAETSDEANLIRRRTTWRFFTRK